MNGRSSPPSALRRNQHHPEGPEAEDDDDEVDGVGEEHEDVDVSDGAVLRLDQSSEELADGAVEGQAPVGGTGQRGR